jgi:hypothetical protein
MNRVMFLKLKAKLLILQWSFQSLSPKIQSINLMGIKLMELWAQIIISQEIAGGGITAQGLITFSEKIFQR